MDELILPRRRFLIGTAISIGSLFVAPSIIRADFSDGTRVSPLMDINRQGNRLVVAFKRPPYSGLEGLIHKESLLNFSQFITPDDYKAWQRFNLGLTYSLQRRDVVDPLSNRIGRYPGSILAQKAMFERDFETAKLSYQDYLRSQKAQIIT